VTAGKAVTLRIAGTDEYRERMARTVAGARAVAMAFVEATSRNDVRVLTGGTDVHQVLLALGDSTVDAERMLERLHVVGVNANVIRVPYDHREPPSSSGIRLGTAALATRGFSTADFDDLGELLVSAFSPTPDSELSELAKSARELTDRYPIYGFVS
jgi:glycine hydroxymethyltransferase